MKRLAFICSIFIGTIASAFGQSSQPEEGTYQLIIHNAGKKELVFTTDFIESLEIENNRLDHSDNTIIVNPTISVFIPSRDKIESENFEKLAFKRYE